MKFLLLAVIGFLLLFSAKSYKLSSYSIDVLETDAVSELNDVSEVKNVSTTVAAPIFPYTVELVVAGFKSDNTTWLEDNFQHWNLSIYTVDDPAAVLSAPLDKGGDSMAYLSYIIDNYANLPDIAVFIHAKQYLWYNDDPAYDGVSVLQRLQLPYIASQGYSSLRCNWSLGCPKEVIPSSTTPDSIEKHYSKAYQELFPGAPIPDKIGAGCCSQFAVTREQILKRPLTDYLLYRDWLVATELDDDTARRILEHSWHMIFGKASVHCPAAAVCYCKMYGLCDLICSTLECHGRYVLPPLADLPPGWPEVQWPPNGAARAPLKVLDANKPIAQP